MTAHLPTKGQVGQEDEEEQQHVTRELSSHGEKATIARCYGLLVADIAPMHWTARAVLCMRLDSVHKPIDTPI